MPMRGMHALPALASDAVSESTMHMEFALPVHGQIAQESILNAILPINARRLPLPARSWIEFGSK